jgi:hypothetical protein
MGRAGLRFQYEQGPLSAMHQEALAIASVAIFPWIAPNASA